ncbi:MAG: AAA domain-containing protein [Candidatus Magasanikbacteria bacterium]|nr:AAA domain-containing protein [Candidatus Magasanikbacteria bacterium]MBT4071425.1 AAA domain-containing protein [Candidatus Magasanikbacteria bacterium]
MKNVVEMRPVQESLYSRILSRLERDFIKSQDLARVLALALQSGKNVLLWGPGGHGKSEMVEAVMAEVVEDFLNEVHVLSFGEGMDEATLWGGLDFRALEEEKVLRYHPESSFLAKEYAVFEELFDAPASVLLALKDTLTSGWLRKGAQRFKKSTRTIVALTNKDPSEIKDLGPAASALVERFPLQLKVDWSSYESTDYVELFEKVEPRLGGPSLNGMGRILAELISKMAEQGDAISPRTAIHALGAVKAAAELRDSQQVEKVDLLDLRFVDGLEGLADSLKEELDKAAERAAAESRVVAAERKLAALLEELKDAERAKSPLRLLKVARHLQSFGDEASRLKVTDGLSRRRKQLRDSAAAKAVEAQRMALENTRV